MNETQTRQLLESAVAEVGVASGDTVYLGIDMSRIALPSYPAALERDALRGRERRWCEFLYDVLRSVIGQAGTMLAPTFTYAYAREGKPYIHEQSPSETGSFTEFLRTIPGAIRSFHPLNSISGIGPNAAAVLNGVGKAGYGVLSPFARLLSHRTKFLFVGAPLGISLTHAHHIEHMYGVNHMYHKLYTIPAFRGGKEDPGPWLCFVRYLGAGIEPCIGHLEQRLREERLLKEVKTDSGPVQCVRVEDVEAIGYEMLRDNPCAFLTDSVEVHVDAPGAAEQPSLKRKVRFSHV